MAGNDSVKLFYLTYALNVNKMKDLVDYFEKMKDKAVTDRQIQNLCSQITNLSENVRRFMNINERLTSELISVKK